MRALLPLILLVAGSSTASAAPLNLLVLYADDWRFDTLGCAGHPVVQTPQIDRLATQGVRFTNSFVTTSICGVSRASLLTGQWMSRHGNRAFGPFRTPWADTYPGQLQSHGYWVGHVGKWHNGPFPSKNYDFGRAYGGRHWLKRPDGSTVHVTQQNERDALEFLRERPKEKPFCLTVAFFAPHAEDSHPKQYLYQPESAELYRDATVPEPASGGAEHLRRLPPFLSSEKNEGRVRWHWRFDTPAKYQEYMKAYFRLVTEVDAACGRVIAELTKQGQLDNTLVIFTADNGYFHSEHGLADKWYPYEESIRVPLIIRDPRMPAERRGQSDDAFVLNVDLAPTFLAAANVDAPKGMQGRDLAPLYVGSERPAWRDDFFYEHGTITNRERIPSSEALVTREWKYIHWPEYDHEELFDVLRDRIEVSNRIADPEQQERLAMMRKRFAELKEAAK